jgi:hypothetical protein
MILALVILTCKNSITACPRRLAIRHDAYPNTQHASEKDPNPLAEALPATTSSFQNYRSKAPWALYYLQDSTFDFRSTYSFVEGGTARSRVIFHSILGLVQKTLGI